MNPQIENDGFEPDNEEPLLVRLGRFLKRVFITAWKEGITLVFRTKLEEPGDPVTGEGRRSKTSVTIKGGPNDQNHDHYIDYDQGSSYGEEPWEDPTKEPHL